MNVRAYVRQPGIADVFDLLCQSMIQWGRVQAEDWFGKHWRLESADGNRCT